MPQLCQFKVSWKPRNTPLIPEAVAARGEAALRLARRLLLLDDETLGRFQGVAGEQLLVLRGAPDLLPWAEGVQYLGTDPEAPSLLSPTNYEPSLPQPLLAKALASRLNAPGPMAVLPFPQPLLLVPMADARPVSRQTLASWLERG